jgi:hypothetical protein
MEQDKIDPKLINYLFEILKKSYFYNLKMLKEKVLRETGLKGRLFFNIITGETKLFLVRFDTIMGPVIASSTDDKTFAEKIKVRLVDLEKDEFKKTVNLGKKEFKKLVEIVQKVSDLDIISEKSDFEFILKKEGIRWNFFFRSFRFKSPANPRGGAESFLLVFVKEESKPEKEKFDKASEIMGELLTKYFELFNEGYIMNKNTVIKFIKDYGEEIRRRHFTLTKEDFGNEEDIIKKYYEL